MFGLIGALLYYGRRGGSAMIGEAAKRWAIGGLIFGFVVPGIDNWAHLGGLGGGYVAARILDPLTPAAATTSWRPSSASSCPSPPC